MTGTRSRPLPGPAGWAVLAFVAAFAVVAHVAYALLVEPNIIPVSDSATFRRLAGFLADGRGYTRQEDPAFAAVATAEFPPGFPALLAVLERVGIDGLREQRAALAVLGAPVAAGGAFLAGHLISSRRAALAVGIVVAVHPALIQPGAAIMSEVLLAPLIVGAMVVAWAWHTTDHPVAPVALGLIGGSATLVRSEAAVLVVLLALGVLVSRRHDGTAQWRAVAWFSVALVLLPGLWAVRNVTTFDEPVLVSNNLGSLLAGANCERTWSGDLVGFWAVGPTCSTGFPPEALAVRDESVLAGELRDRGLDHIRSELPALPRVAAVRVLRTFQIWEPEQQVRLSTFEGRDRRTERIAGWVLWATLPLAAVGLLDLIRRRERFTAWFLGVPVLVVVLLSAATYGNPRFRVSADVALVLAAALGIRTVLDRVRGGESRPVRAGTATGV